jgi:hypothetical protein
MAEMTTDAIRYTLEKIGHGALSDLLDEFKRNLQRESYALELRLTVKEDSVAVAASIKHIPQMGLPLAPELTVPELLHQRLFPDGTTVTLERS